MGNSKMRNAKKEAKLRRAKRAKLLATTDSKEIKWNTFATAKESSLQRTWKLPAKAMVSVNSGFSSLYFACLLSIKQKMTQTILFKQYFETVLCFLNPSIPSGN